MDADRSYIEKIGKFPLVEFVRGQIGDAGLELLEVEESWEGGKLGGREEGEEMRIVKEEEER